MSRDGWAAHPHGATGLSAVLWLWYFLIILIYYFWSGWMGEFSQFYAKLIGVNVGRWESARKVGLLIWVIIAPLWERGRLYRILVVCHSVRSSARHIFFHFRCISWELFYRIYPNFVCALILAWSSLGLLHVIFTKLVQELRPLIYAKISFPLNILRTHWQNFTKFYICIYINKI